MKSFYRHKSVLANPNHPVPFQKKVVVKEKYVRASDMDNSYLASADMKNNLYY
jgi:hypothetical protein